MEPEEVSKHFPKPNVNQKSHGHWWSAAHLIHYSFLNPSETITSEKYAQQIDKMPPNIAMPAAGIGQQKGPSSTP